MSSRDPRVGGIAREEQSRFTGFEDKRTERAGFEPAKEREPLTRLAGECLQPLGHLSEALGAV